jgi:hypothetical protein
VYEDNKKKNKNFKFSDALKLASMQYKKRGGKSDLPEDVEEKNVVDMDANSEEPALVESAPVKAVDSEVEVKDVVVEPESEVKVKDVVESESHEEEVVPMDTSEGGKKKNKTKKGGKSKKSQRKSKKSQRKSKRNHRK